METNWIAWLILAAAPGCLCLLLNWPRLRHRAQLRQLHRVLEGVAIPPYCKVRPALHHEFERARRLGYELSVVSAKARPRQSVGFHRYRRLRAGSAGIGGVPRPNRPAKLGWIELWTLTIMEIHRTTRAVDVVATDFGRGSTHEGILLLVLGNNADGTRKMLERIRGRIADTLGLELVCGTAQFPNDATVLEELVDLARHRAVRDKPIRSTRKPVRTTRKQPFAESQICWSGRPR